MEDVDSPYILLNWLQSGAEEMQLSALEQLCLALLQFENNETLVKFYPPSTYIPILACLCQNFDISLVLLEAIIRTITYYMQALPHEVINRLVNTKGSLVAICMRLENPNMGNAIESDLTQQIIKLLEELCKRDTKSLSNIGGASYIISYMSKTYQIIHLDTIKSGFFILYKIIDKIDPTDNRLAEWFSFLSNFFNHNDSKIVEYTLHCLLSIVKTCNEKKISTDHLGIEKIIDDLLEMTMSQLKMDNQTYQDENLLNNIPTQNSNNKVGLSRVVIDLILCIIRGSYQFLCNLLMKNKLVDIILEIIWQYEGSSASIMQLIEGLFDQISERNNYKSTECSRNTRIPPMVGLKIIHNRMYNEEMIHQYSKYHDFLLNAIRNGNLDHVKELLLSTDFDLNYKDCYGQTSLNWASAIGFIECVKILYSKGVDPYLGERGSSFHYAAAHGHINIIQYFIKNQTVNFYIRDCEGLTVIDRLNHFMEINVACIKNNEIKELINKIENQNMKPDEDIILAKQNFIRRMIPILINIYLKNHKSVTRYQVLELLGKIFQSFTGKDHDIFIHELHQENVLLFHLSKLIYRVILQDTGENVLEAIKLCLSLASDKEYSHIYLTMFKRMGIYDILISARERFEKVHENKSTESTNDAKIIPLSYDIEFSENKNILKSQNYTLNLHQPYYWGDWNIITTDDGLNLYNEYCYVFISTEESAKNLKTYILTRKTVSSDSMGRDITKKKNQLFDNLNKCKNWKSLPDDVSSGFEKSNYRETLNEKASESEYISVEISDRNVNYKPDIVENLLSKYSSILLSVKPVSLPIQFPKLPLGKLINVRNLVISSFTNQLKISCDLSKKMISKLNINNTNTKELNDISHKEERCFIEISINSFAGLIMRSENQVFYKSGPLNKQSGLKRLELSNSTISGHYSSKIVRPNKNLLKDAIRFRLEMNSQNLLSCLQTVEKFNNVFERNVFQLFSLLKNNEPQYQEIKYYFNTFNKLFASHKTRPTPYELYSSQFIKLLEFIFQKFDSEFLNDLLIIIYPNLTSLTKMLIQLLEQIEDLQSFYQLNSFISEHYLTRSIYMNTKIMNCNDHHEVNVDPIPDLSKYNFLVMPLSSPTYLMKRLNNLLQKLPWYRADKNSYNSIRQLLIQPYYVNIPYEAENPAKGIFNWLGTNGFYSDLFMNPLKLDLIVVSVSDNSSNLLNCFQSLFVPNSNLVHKNYVSIHGQNCFLTIELKHPIGLLPSHYKIGCPITTDVNMLTLINWKLMASVDGIEWDTLSIHQNDCSLLESDTGSHVWELNIEPTLLEKVKSQGWSMFRILQIPQNQFNDDIVKDYQQDNPCNTWQGSSFSSSNGFWMNYIEFYGTVLGISTEIQQNIKENVSNYLSKFTIRSLVVPGSDWVFDNIENYKIGRTLTSIKNGLVLVEWNLNSGKCHLRHKMGSQGKYEISLAPDVSAYDGNESDEMVKNTLLESLNERRSSNDIHQEPREILRNSYQDSISWVVDPNVSMPLRTSSLSSQRNSRFPTLSNKDNWIDVNNYPEDSRNFKNHLKSSEEIRDFNRLLQSESEEFEIHNRSSDFENIHLDCSFPKVTIGQNKKRDENEFATTTRSIIPLIDDMSSRNNEDTKIPHDSKQNFTSLKQTKRKNYHIVNMVSENKKEILKKDVIRFNTLTEDIEMSDENENFEILHSPENFIKPLKTQDKNETGQSKPTVKRKPYNSFVKNNKLKQSGNGICETNTKFKPINIDQTFPGLIPSIDHRSTTNITQIRSNVETLNYRPKKKSCKIEESNRVKNFGYDPSQLRVKLEIQKLSPMNNPLYYQKFYDFNENMDNPDEDQLNLQFKEKEQIKKIVYEYILDPNSTLPIANYILKMLPPSDPILNIYPLDNVSEMWHSQFTLYYGFCDKINEKSTCKNCFYENVKNPRIINEKIKPLNEIELVLNILNRLKMFQIKFMESSNDQLVKNGISEFNWKDSCFISHYICRKLLAQLEDIWCLISRETLPTWVIEWPQKYPFLFFFNVKVDILKAFWLGVSRSIIWLQQKYKPSSDFIRPSFREDVVAPFHFLGRLKKHIAQVPRPIYFGNTDFSEFESKSVFWSAVKDLFLFHAQYKEELEIQFEQEEGTGQGPTLEFINILSKEFLKSSNMMWVHTDSLFDNGNEFVHAENGLFPSPCPADKLSEEVLEKFHIFGIFIAKCLQDNRRIDLSLSEPFLKLLCKDFTEYDLKEYLNDFSIIFPERGTFLKLIVMFLEEKEKLLHSDNRDGHGTLWKFHDQLKSLATDILGATFDSLCIDMEFLPSSVIFGNHAFSLLDHYPWEDNSETHNDICNFGNETDSIREPVTEYNAESYLCRTLLFAMNKGIKRQIMVLKDGFNEVFPIKCLDMFSVLELKQLLCGEQYIQWTMMELKMFTEPTQGYTFNSLTYQNFLEVLYEMSQIERTLFVQFVTGSTSLPPGGIRALKPRLTIVKKNAKDNSPYPSVNTCMHYLKLPEYESKTELKSKLLEACKQIGFYLN